ncbi:hypothetical protein JK361_40175 [Streptomyces sp. 5-8]|uniref:Uncharacterized protein n=1 Tax=Streptomyces musisoli TaxID=2802280 RepID=A0ABS1PE71_9ACTN|nr:hypothetical protein [Streptomyces musisoli]MBL1110686.1 hypothetical protein [Streptomyces musisoli]
MIKASMTMVDKVMVGTRDTAIACGGHDARPDWLSAYAMGETGKGLMRACRELMAQESSIAAAILGKQVDLTYSMGNPAADCSESFLGLGQELPEVVGDTAWCEQ